MPFYAPPVGSQINLGNPLCRGLTGYWPMLEGRGEYVNDAAFKRRTGTLVAMEPELDWGAGQYGPSLLFDELNEYVAIPNYPSDLSLSLMAWFAGTDASGIWYSAGYNVATAGVVLYPSAGKARFKVNSASGQVTIIGSTTITDGKWHCVIGTWDGTEMRLFVDGVEDATAVLAASPANYVTNLAILGAFSTVHKSGNNAWAGNIANVAEWDRALPVNEVSTLYRDYWAMYRRPQQGVAYSAAAPPTGRIMGSLVGQGGLVGPGGIIGQSGGIVA